MSSPPPTFSCSIPKVAPEKLLSVKQVGSDKEVVRISQIGSNTKVSPTLWFAHSSRLVLTKLPAGREEKEEEEKGEEEGEEHKEEEEEEGNESPPTYPGRFRGQGMPHPLFSLTSPFLS